MERGLQHQQAEGRANPPALERSLLFTDLQIWGRNMPKNGPETRGQVGARPAGQRDVRCTQALL